MSTGDTSVNEVDQVPAFFFFFFCKECGCCESGVKKDDLVRGGSDRRQMVEFLAKKEWAQERDEKGTSTSLGVKQKRHHISPTL